MNQPQKKVGDFLANLVAPNMEPQAPPDIDQAIARAGAQGPVGAPPVDAEAIKEKAGAPQEVLERARQAIDPMLMKEIEVIHLKIKLAETEEELLVQRVQEVRRRRAEFVHIQRNLLSRAKGQVVVGPNGTPQAAPG